MVEAPLYDLENSNDYVEHIEYGDYYEISPPDIISVYDLIE